MTMKLYAVSDGPPSLAVRMVFQTLNIPYELIDVDFIAGEHMTAEYAKMNPQKEIPVLDDAGFYLSESIAIMQYLCDKYAPNNPLYPRDPAKRAIVNHRLCFNMAFYYSAISAHCMAPIFFDYQRTDMSLKKVNNALNVLETYLREGGTKYAATDNVTIADFALITATICLEAINFDLSTYPLVIKWYERFKQENPDSWIIANAGMQEIAQFEKNPPDLSHMNHPFHPTRKAKVSTGV
ncbi:glutathione S-transferase 1-1 isoform X2 [Eurosta solidaginis]